MTKTLLPTVSSAEQWLHCPASFKAQIAFPRLDSSPRQSALEGRSCHTMLEELRDGKKLIPGELDAKHNVVRTLEMIEAVHECFAATPPTASIEKRIDLSSIYPSWYGYCDAYDAHEDMLDVYDYKFGRTFVGVEENIQLISYALGIAHLHVMPDHMNVTLHIIQPRSYQRGEENHRKWATTVGELRNYIPKIRAAIEEALSKVPTATTGNQCKYCTARAHCKTFKDAQNEWLEFSSLLSLENITTEQLSVDLKLVTKALDHLTNAKNALEEQVEWELKQGGHVPGYALTTVKGRQRFKDGSEEAIINIGKLFGVDVTKSELLTPKQIEKKGVDKVVISSYIETPVSLKLVPFTSSDIAKLFNNK